MKNFIIFLICFLSFFSWKSLLANECRNNHNSNYNPNYNDNHNSNDNDNDNYNNDDTNSNPFPTLNEARDPILQNLLNQELNKLDPYNNLGIKNAIQTKNLALALIDVTDLYDPRAAFINDYVMMYAASLPKIAILLGAYQWLDDGYGDNISQNNFSYHVNRMIRNSSNYSATWVYNLIGQVDYLQEVLLSDIYGYKLYDMTLNGGLWVGKEYGKKGKRVGDPLYDISHGANPFQVARLYYLILTERLVSPESSNAMLEVLSNSAIHHKFVKGLQNYYGSDFNMVTIYRKSGSWRTFHSDSAIIERDERLYIAVALSNNANGAAWMQKLIVVMDQVIDLFCCFEGKMSP